MRVVLMGPPGAGKGTQARMLVEKYQLAEIATGDILREEVRAGSELGRKAKGFMDKGALVPDGLVVKMVEQRLARNDCSRGFVLDGFPRNVKQAESLDSFMEQEGCGIDAIISLTVPVEDLVKRLSGRRTCRSCGWRCHLLFEPPVAPGKCDECGGELYQRDDDKEDVIRSRLEVYDRETAPVLSHYRRQGKLREVAGGGSPEEVFARVMRELSPVAPG